MDLRFRVVSDSMLPLLKIGDELEVSAIPSVLQPFDILLFKRNEKLFAHFVWRYQKNQNTIVTRSLKEPYRDEAPVKLEEVLGKIEGVKFSFFLKLRLFCMNWMRGSY